jgi:hypothetical protein
LLFLSASLAGAGTWVLRPVREFPRENLHNLFFLKSANRTAAVDDYRYSVKPRTCSLAAEYMAPSEDSFAASSGLILREAMPMSQVLSAMFVNAVAEPCAEISIKDAVLSPGSTPWTTLSGYATAHLQCPL